MENSTTYSDRTFSDLLITVSQVSSIITNNLWHLFYLGGDDYATPDKTQEGSLGAYALIADMALPIAREILTPNYWDDINSYWDDWIVIRAREMYAEKYPDHAHLLEAELRVEKALPQNDYLVAYTVDEDNGSPAMTDDYESGFSYAAAEKFLSRLPNRGYVHSAYLCKIIKTID